MTEPRQDLESVQIPEPCSADWASMLGDEQRRYCDQCQLHVHNVSAMPREEAEALIAKRDEGQKVCVRMEYDAAGACVTAESPREVSPQKATALALALGTGLLAACRTDEPRAPEEPQTVENAAVESGEPARIGQVLQGSLATPVADEGAEAPVEGCDDELEPQEGILMGRIAIDGAVTVNADGQLTEGDDAACAESSDAACLQPTMGEVAPSEAADAPTDPDDAKREALIGKVKQEKKRTVILGSPGPPMPKPKIEPDSTAKPKSSSEPKD